MKELSEADITYLYDLLILRQEELKELRKLAKPLVSCKVGIDQEILRCEELQSKLR